jgi:lysylphosphatidylglycerol synthase-like protein
MKRHARTVGIVLALAIALAVAIRQRAMFATAAGAVWTAGWILIPAFVLFLLWNHVATIGWRELAVAASEHESTPSMWQLALVRLEAQALNVLFPVAGEVARAAQMSNRRGRVSVAVDLVTTTIAEAAFAVIALLLHPRFRPTHGSTLALLGLLGVAIAAAWAWLPALVAPLASRFPSLAWGPGLLPAFRRATFWHLMECVLGVGEIWLFAVAFGISLDFISIFFAAAAVRSMTTLGGFVPGQIGVAEGSLVWVLTALGQPAAAGLAIAFARRGRQLVVLAVGALLLIVGRQLHAQPREAV